MCSLTTFPVWTFGFKDTVGHQIWTAARIRPQKRKSTPIPQDKKLPLLPLYKLSRTHTLSLLLTRNNKRTHTHSTNNNHPLPSLPSRRIKSPPPSLCLLSTPQPTPTLHSPSPTNSPSFFSPTLLLTSSEWWQGGREAWLEGSRQHVTPLPCCRILLSLRAHTQEHVASCPASNAGPRLLLSNITLVGL